MGVRVSTDGEKGKGKRPSDGNPFGGADVLPDYDHGGGKRPSDVNAPRARARSQVVPSKGDLVGMAMDCYELALSHENTWVQKDGTERTTRKTDLRAALDAVRTLQTLLGYDKRDDGPKTPEQMAEFRRELVRFATTDPETVALLEEARKGGK